MAINLANPVNWDSPLNRGLVARYIALPGGVKGCTFSDVVGKFDGVMNSGASWTSARHSPGFLDSVQFNGTTGKATITGELVKNGAVTIAAWALADSTSAGSHNIFATGTSSAYVIQIRRDSANWSFYINDGVSDLTPTISKTITAGVWYRILATNDGTTSHFYINGNQEGSVSVVPGPARYGTISSIGCDDSDGGNIQFWDGRINDLAVYARSFTENEAKLDYVESITGYRTVFKRAIKVPTIFLPSAGSFKSAWARGSNVILQPGVLT